MTSSNEEILFKKSRARIAILISGRGSNMKALLDAEKQGRLQGEIVVVITNNPDAKGIKTAIEYGKQVLVFSTREMTQKEHEDKVMEALEKSNVDFIVLAGYMRILSKEFVNAFLGRIINIHPSLLPCFPGLNAQEQALNAGVKVSGCTVHFVTPEVDSGPIIIQKCVPVLVNDTVESLSQRILKEEHVAIVEALEQVLQGKVTFSIKRTSD